MGSYRPDQLRVEDIIQVGACKGPVTAEAVRDQHGRLAVVFVCWGHGVRHTVTMPPTRLVSVVCRAPRVVAA